MKKQIFPALADTKIAVFGLGYVGLPLAVSFSRHFDTVGYDINETRVDELSQGKDHTLEVEESVLKASTLRFSHRKTPLKACNVFVVTVPTPIDAYKRPDLTPLTTASNEIGQCLSKGDVVIYESTVYPGATEEVCVPVLEEVSGLRYNKDFFVGYSPERINPGDQVHRLETIVKVTAGSTKETADYVDAIYSKVITAGTHKVSSLAVAEAAKVIENTQRDVNIALINELAMIFNRLGLDTLEVLEAAGTKWNFLPFRPGLVGGHCIGVDPYYLTHKAQSVGYHPEMILAGRRINDNMAVYVATEVAKAMMRARIHIKDAEILILGVTFKENCPDTRNSKVVRMANEFKSFGAKVKVYDPWANIVEVEQRYGLEVVKTPSAGKADALVLAVAHDEYLKLGVDAIRKWGKENHVFYDVKQAFPRDKVDARL